MVDNFSSEEGSSGNKPRFFSSRIFWIFVGVLIFLIISFLIFSYVNKNPDDSSNHSGIVVDSPASAPKGVFADYNETPSSNTPTNGSSPPNSSAPAPVGKFVDYNETPSSSPPDNSSDPSLLFPGGVPPSNGTFADI